MSPFGVVQSLWALRNFLGNNVGCSLSCVAPLWFKPLGLNAFLRGTFVVLLWLQWLVVLVCIVGFLWADGDCNGVSNRRLGHAHFKIGDVSRPIVMTDLCAADSVESPTSVADTRLPMLFLWKGPEPSPRNSRLLLMLGRSRSCEADDDKTS